MPKNRISQLRKARGLTQQALAKLAGTSQQQVQRIEAGVQGARLELAMKISAALGAELPDVFPALAPERKRSLRDSRYYIDDQKLQDAGLDPDPKSWTAKFFAFDGRIFEYVVPSDEKARLEKLFSQVGEGIVAFSSRTHWVAINRKKIAATQFLFDVGLSESEDEKEEELELKLHLIGAGQPVVFGIEPDTILLEEDENRGASQMQNLFFQLEANFDEMVSFYDEDRERVYLKSTEVLAIEVPVVCCEPALWNAEIEGASEVEIPAAVRSRDSVK